MAKKEKTICKSVYLKKEEFEKVAEIAEQEDRSISNIIRILMNEGIKKRDKK